jgi:hypothetical protein
MKHYLQKIDCRILLTNGKDAATQIDLEKKLTQWGEDDEHQVADPKS